MRLSVSPATPFSVASLPNHTKMFELVHVVTSIDDFAIDLALSPVHCFPSYFIYQQLELKCPDKKKTKFSSYVRTSRSEQLQSHT
jgi:hypothetical protein